MFVNLIELLVVAGSWWLIFASVYRVFVGWFEVYFQPDDVIVDDVYTVFSLAGILTFLWLAPLMLA